MDQTVKEMWETFLRQATRNRPGRKVPVEWRVAYYAGCHNMLAMLRAGEAKPGEWAAAWQKLSDELSQFSDDYRNGKV